MSSNLGSKGVKTSPSSQLTARFIQFLVLVSITLSLGCFLPPVSFFLEVSRNFGHYYLVVHLVSLLWVIWSIRQRFTVRVVLILLLLVILIGKYLLILSPFYLPQETIHTGPTPSSVIVKVLSANLYGRNTDYETFPRLVASKDPDIILLTEYTPRWREVLNLKGRFPYSHEIPQDGFFGIGLFSKFPFEGAPVTALDPELPPIINQAVRVSESHVIELFGIHAVPPVSGENFAANKILFKKITTSLKHREGSAIVFGDLNITPFSFHYSPLIKYARLNNASNGFGFRRTWDATGLYKRFMIDHILYRGPFSVHEYSVLPYMGSDHYPIFAELEQSSK